MSRGWFVLLALSVGLNLGLLGGRLLAERPPERDLRRHERPDGPPDPERLVDMHLQRMDRELDLTDPQRERIGALMRETMPRMMEARRALSDAREALSESYAAETLDDAAFRAAAAEVKSAQGALDSLTADLMLREAEILTPEQREENGRRMPWRRGGFDRRRDRP